MADKIKKLKNKIYQALSDPEAPWYGSDLVSWVGDYIDEVEERIKEFEVELEQHRWIPVSERLPKPRIKVLTARWDWEPLEIRSEEIQFAVAWMGESCEWWTDTNGSGLYKPNFWKPIILPEQPRKES